MKMLAPLSAAFIMISAPALAGEWADQCVARLSADGRDTSGCACLEEKIGASPALIDEFKMLGAIEDRTARYEAASPEAKAAMDACTRKPQ